MYYAIWFEDKPNSVELRASLRAKHLAYIKERSESIMFAGPLLSQDGLRSIGGLIVIDLPTPDAAQEFAYHDPYFVGGLFQNALVRPWRRVALDSVS